MSPLSSAAFPRKTLSVLLLTALLAACSPKQEGGAPPPPTVSVITANPQSIALETTLTGRLEASRKAEIRARVPGVLQKRLFTEGSEVKAGQALFTIDDAPYRAARMTAQANFAKAKADMGRMKPLMEAGAISKQEWDAIVQMYQVSKANLDTADINMGYAHVTAPISGRIGRAIEPEGALVGQGVPTLLAVIQQNDPMYINLTQSAGEVMKMRQALAVGQLQGAGDEVAVTISFEDGSTYPLEGKLLFTDPTVNESTGQVSLRAEIPNPDGILFPGLFVKVHITQAEVPNAVAVPQQAVTRSTQGDTVMVANADGTFAPRPITIGGEKGQSWIVTGGLQAGDQVIVDGMSVVQITGAQKVQTRPWQAEGTAAPQAAAAASTEHTSASEAENTLPETPAESASDAAAQ
ncbi:MAG: efflux RND transporter periplasmic adaptor subunit [Neisseria sp.]|nr:efflux RND transporter periplasmic adaptor subunit [Neisseria sp.]